MVLEKLKTCRTWKKEEESFSHKLRVEFEGARAPSLGALTVTSTDSNSESNLSSSSTNDDEVLLEPRYAPLPWLGQVLLLMSKRLNVLPHTIIPLLFAMAIPIIIVGPLTMTFMAGYLLPDCHRDRKQSQECDLEH